MKTIFIIALIILIIWLIVKKINLENTEKIKQISGELRVKYPHFVSAIRSVYQNQALLFADNNKALCYKIEIKTYQKHMGDTYYSIIDTTNIGNKPYLIQIYKGLDGIEISTERYYLENNNDLEVEDYLKIFDDFAKEVMSDERYLRSISRSNEFEKITIETLNSVVFENEVKAKSHINPKVRIKVNPRSGQVFTQSLNFNGSPKLNKNGETYGYIRVISEDGSRSALKTLTVKVFEEAKHLLLPDAIVENHKIIIKESLIPFFEGQEPVQLPVYSNNEIIDHIILTSNNQPVYRNTILTENMRLQDELLEHD